MTDQEQDEKLAIVQSHVAQLMEHFDTVRVFVTKHESEEEGTAAWSCGGGNVYAQEGQVRGWIERDETPEED